MATSGTATRRRLRACGSEHVRNDAATAARRAPPGVWSAEGLNPWVWVLGDPSNPVAWLQTLVLYLALGWIGYMRIDLAELDKKGPSKRGGDGHRATVTADEQAGGLSRLESGTTHHRGTGFRTPDRLTARTVKGPLPEASQSVRTLKQQRHRGTVGRRRSVQGSVVEAPRDPAAVQRELSLQLRWAWHSAHFGALILIAWPLLVPCMVTSAMLMIGAAALLASPRWRYFIRDYGKKEPVGVLMLRRWRCSGRRWLPSIFGVSVLWVLAQYVMAFTCEILTPARGVAGDTSISTRIGVTCATPLPGLSTTVQQALLEWSGLLELRPALGFAVQLSASALLGLCCRLHLIAVAKLTQMESNERAAKEARDFDHRTVSPSARASAAERYSERTSQMTPKLAVPKRGSVPPSAAPPSAATSAAPPLRPPKAPWHC